MLRDMGSLKKCEALGNAVRRCIAVICPSPTAMGGWVTENCAMGQGPAEGFSQLGSRKNIFLKFSHDIEMKE